MNSPDWWSGWRHRLRAIDRSPGPEWRDRTVHHGFRLLVGLLGAAVIALLFPRAPVPDFTLLEEGEVAPEDVIAQLSFPVRKSEERLAAERRDAEQSVRAIFRFDSTAVDSALSHVERFFGGLDSVTEAAGPEREARSRAAREWLEGRGLQANPTQAEYLASAENRRLLRQELDGAFRELLPRGVVPRSDLEEASALRLVLRQEERDRLVPRDSLLTVGEFYRRAAGRRLADSAAAAVQLYQTLLVRLSVPTVHLDRMATRMAREQARSAVEETDGYVLEGERIVGAHERVSGSQVQKLRAYREALLERGRVAGGARLLQGAGGFLYSFLLLALLGAVLYYYRGGVYRSASGFLIVVVAVVVVMAAGSLVARAESSPFLVPVALASLVVAALYDGLLGVVVAAVIAALLAGQPPFVGLTAPFAAFVAGTAGAITVPWIRRRAQSWMIIAAVTGAYLLAATSLALLRYFSSPADLLAATGWGAVNATLSTVLAMGAAVPALESITGRVTDQTLLEMADLNRPLLRRLSREAPGTYAHSVNVANLSEAACTAIGANALLARVGVYYHDIGKLARPQYFIENQPQNRNPHDRLHPSRSAEVIREHVRDGLRLAEEAGLPEAVKDFIREHHGTRQISYFLEKAKREEPGLDLDPTDFTYPGPKPQTKETAVAMLADGVESATRALRDPTPGRIQEVLEAIFEERIEERQLDQCPLTLRDLDRIEEQFVRVLSGMYHHRIDYPAGEEEEVEPAPEAEYEDRTVSPVRPEQEPLS